MKFKIQRDDSLSMMLFKTVYMVPYVIVVYPLAVVVVGAKELGWPFSGYSSYINGAYIKWKETD